MIIEGKEPHKNVQFGEAIESTKIASTLVPEFRKFIKQMNDTGIGLDLNHLIGSLIRIWYKQMAQK